MLCTIKYYYFLLIQECSQSVDLDERPSHEEIADNKKPTHIETMDVDEGIRIDFAVEKAGV